jgi:hypothetical protein
MIDPQGVKGLAVAETLAPTLAGLGPDVQSVALADLLARYLAGWDPARRAEVRQLFDELVDQLVPINEEIMFGGTGHPGEQRQ